MASVSGVSSSNANSIYGNRNVLTGLATGMDTESMIENAISGYKLKINNLLKQQTSLSWQQEAFRNISDPMVQFARKYASYTSSTNLLSSSFFNNAVNTTSQGDNAKYVSASGKTASDVRILGVKQLATKSAYSVSAGALGLGGSENAATITARDALDLSLPQELSKVSGTLSLTYGAGRVIDLSFGDKDLYRTTDEFVKGINDKLDDVMVTNSEGKSVAASTMVKAKLEGGKIVFSDQQSAGNSIVISDATGELKKTLQIDTTAKATSLDVSGLSDGDLVNVDGTMGDYLSGKTFNLTVDGKTKTITLPQYDSTLGTNADSTFVAGINDAVQKAFGSRVKVELDGDNKIQITGQKGSTISLSASDAVGQTLGLGGSTATSYLNTGHTLGSLLGLDYALDPDDNLTEKMAGIDGRALRGEGTITYDEESKLYFDSEGNRTNADGMRLGKDGRQLFGYELEINGVSMTFTRDTALESVLTKINSDSEIGYSATFSKTTNQLQLTAKETGSMGALSINAKLAVTDANGDIVKDDAGNTVYKDNLAAKIFGVVNDPTAPAGALKGKYEEGQDAILSMSVNGVTYEDVIRNDNTFDVDGLSVTLKDAFGYSEDVKDADGNVTAAGTLQSGTEAVTFTTAADADKIVEAVKGMVEDLNKIMQAAHSAYSDMPLLKNNKTRYEPLTDEDQEGMTESAIKNYEEKAKTGILFGDRDLTSMYDKLLDAVAPGGSNGSLLRSLGITTNYSQGITTLEVDETMLRDALSKNPDSVRDAFTKTDNGGGLMVNLNKVLDEYVSTTGSTKGILIEKAGSSYSALSMLHNTLLDQIDALDIQIDSWQEKMSDKIDYYTQQFSRLEQLTQQMNSQSSMLMGMMGGGGY